MGADKKKSKIIVLGRVLCVLGEFLWREKEREGETYRERNIKRGN